MLERHLERVIGVKTRDTTEESLHTEHKESGKVNDSGLEGKTPAKSLRSASVPHSPPRPKISHSRGTRWEKTEVCCYLSASLTSRSMCLFLFSVIKNTVNYMLIP